MATTLLIIENGEKSAANLVNYLRGTGLMVERVKDTAEARERIAQRRPDLLLFHLKPPAKVGTTFIESLHRNPGTRNVPIVLISTAYGGAAYQSLTGKMGIKACLEAPFAMSRLANVIRSALPTLTTVPMPLHRHLRRALLSGFSGIYSLRRIGAAQSLVFFEGVPVYLAPGFFHGDFGLYLRHRNIISAAENSYFRGEGQLRHEALVQMGCLEFGELLQEKLVYLTEELIAAFGQPPVAVTEQPFCCPPGMQPIGVNVPDVFHQGFQRHADLPSFKRQLSSQGYSYLAPADNYFRYVKFLSLTENERRFLQKLDGSHTLREALDGDSSLEPLVLTLATLNMLQFNASPGQLAMQPSYPLRVPFNETAGDAAATDTPLESFLDLVKEVAAETEIPAAPGTSLLPEGTLPNDIVTTLEGLNGKDYYAIFGLTAATFTPAKLRDRYFHYTRTYNPTLLMQLSGETAAAAEELLERVATAYNILCDEVKRERYDDLLRRQTAAPEKLSSERIQAQVQARAGMIHLHRKEWEAAEKALHEACALDPFNGEWLAHLAWAIYRNPQHRDSRSHRDKARMLINRALGLSRSAPGHAYSGWMLFEANQNQAALEEFAQALQLDDRLTLARDGQKAAKKHSEERRKGFFRRIFGT